MSKLLQLHCPASCLVLCDPSDPGISPSCPEGLCTCSSLNSLECFVLFSLCAFCPPYLNPAWLVLLCPSDLVWTPIHTAPKSWPLLFPCLDMPSFLLPGAGAELSQWSQFLCAWHREDTQLCLLNEGMTPWGIYLCNLSLVFHPVIFPQMSKEASFFKIILFLYFLAVLGLCCCVGFLSNCGKWGPLCSCGVQASHCGGFFSYWSMGSKASAVVTSGL